MRKQNNSQKRKTLKPKSNVSKNQQRAFNAMVLRNRQRLMSRSNQSPRMRQSLLPSTMRNQSPRQITSGNQSRIVRREPLATVNGSVAFAIQTFQINPGLATVFPWLSAQAAGYESYKVNSLSVEYKFTTNEFTGKGRIIIAPDYDSSDEVPTSAVQAEQMADSVMGAVAKNWTCHLRPRGIGILGPKRYTRSATLAANEDIKTYDIAQIHVVTQGQTDGAEIGQLWLNYDITLSEPQPQSLGNIVSSGSITNSTGANATILNLLGDTDTVEGTLAISHVLNDVTIRNCIPGQTYLVAYHGVAATYNTAPTITYVSNATSTNSSELLSTLNGGTTNGWSFRYFIASDSTVVLSLGAVSVLTTPSRCTLTVNACVNYS